MSSIGWDPRLTLFTCLHPPAQRWLSTCGWVEVCAGCNECRTLEENGVPGPGYWPAASRTEIREHGWCLSYDLAGVLKSRRPVGSSVEPL